MSGIMAGVKSKDQAETGTSGREKKPCCLEGNLIANPY
jgi:hypothetical protein